MPMIHPQQRSCFVASSDDVRANYLIELSSNSITRAILDQKLEYRSLPIAGDWQKELFKIVLVQTMVRVEE
jgi:hypothetical protein